MIAAATPRRPSSRRPSTAPTDGAAGRHWSHSTFYVRVPDLNDETRRRIARAGSTWDLLWRALRSQERRGRTAEVKAAAARAVLLDVGVAGLARMGGQHPATVARHLATLAVVGLVRVTRQTPRIERDDRGRIKASSGRERPAVIELTVGPDHLRPFGAQRVDPPRSLSVRSAVPSISPTLTGLGNQSRTPEPPRRPACGAGHRAADPAAAAAAPPPPVELLIEERGTTPEKLVVSCPNCGDKKQASPQSARDKAGLTLNCGKCSTPVRTPAEPAIHAAFQRAAERRATEDPAGPVATPTVAATGSSPPPLSAAGGRDDRPAQATPEAPVDDDEVAMVERQIAELRRREDEPVRELERIIDEQRKRDAGYVVPASVNKAIVTRWTGRSA